MARIDVLLTAFPEQGASDLHVIAGAPSSWRRLGETHTLDFQVRHTHG